VPNQILPRGVEAAEAVSSDDHGLDHSQVPLRFQFSHAANRGKTVNDKTK
jgi:hypothetical protein